MTPARLLPDGRRVLPLKPRPMCPVDPPSHRAAGSGPHRRTFWQRLGRCISFYFKEMNRE